MEPSIDTRLVHGRTAYDDILRAVSLGLEMMERVWRTCSAEEREYCLRHARESYELGRVALTVCQFADEPASELRESLRRLGTQLDEEGQL